MATLPYMYRREDGAYRLGGPLMNWKHDLIISYSGEKKLLIVLCGLLLYEKLVGDNLILDREEMQPPAADNAAVMCTKRQLVLIIIVN